MVQPDAALAVSPLGPGYRLDRYELLGPLSQGGMASVWIARQRGKHGFEKLVALKTILPEYASDLRFQQMFLNEARIASRIEHFNVARILDLGEEHDVIYIAMEYVDGDSLAKLRRAWQERRLAVPAGIVLRILAEVCSGLHDAHELRGEDGRALEIVHRDVSPHNILVSTKGAPKLIDFGIAKACDRLAGDTNAGVLRGKIAYMAPEQAMGRRVDRRSDVWGVGASLYHLLSGKPPFDSENTLSALQILTSGRPPVPLPDIVHPAIAAVAHKALSPAPEMRYESAAEMRDAIEAAMIDAKMVTTSADVAAFVVENLAERIAKRRNVIDIALAAAADRERVRDLLQPSIDRHDSGAPSEPESAGTRAARPTALRSGGPYSPVPPLSATLPPKRPVSDMPAHSPGRIVLVGGLLGGGLALVGAAAIAMLWSRHDAGQAPIVIATAAAASPPPTPGVRAASPVASPAPAESAANAGIPLISADMLPRAGPLPPSTAAPSVTPGSAVRRPVPFPPPRKKVVDDGF